MSYIKNNSYNFLLGQFRAIAKELGYSEEYNKGELRYEKGNEVFKTNFDEIRSHIAEEKTTQIGRASCRERV